MTARKRKGAAPATDHKPAAVMATPATGDTREPDYRWNGRPVFKCHAKPGCHYSRVDNLAAVLRHETEHDALPAPARDSLIVGTNGKPLKVDTGDTE